MFRPFIVPLTIAVLLMVGGVVIAVQPVVDPGYVHPLGLLLTGMFFAMCGVAFTAVCIGFAFSEKRDAEHNARVAAARETHLYGAAGWGEPVNVAYLGDGTVATW